MASEIRVNSLTNRSGLSTVSITDAGLNAVGIITAHNFKTGTTNVHSTGVTAADGVFTGNVSVTGNLNVSGALTYEDVTNVDAVGLSTFQNGIHVTGGSVGIGTDNPAEILHLNGATTKSLLRFTSGTYGVSSSDGSHIGINFGGLELWHKENNYLRFGTNNTERLRIKSDGAAYFSGNLGLGGQTSPASNIHIGDISAGYELKISANALQFNRSSNSYIDQLHDTGSILFRMTSSNTEAMRITSAGRMGLGTNDPAALLEVRDSENTTKGVAQIRISKGVGNGAAPTSVSRADSYLHIGGSEYHTSFGRYNIAFGYTNDEVGSGIPAYIGFVETSLAGYTQGDLVFGTRGNTTGTDNPTERLRIGSGGGHKITCAEGYYAANLTECNDSRIALNINQTRGGQTKAIAIGAISANTATGIQCYDTSDNSANNLILNPFGGNMGLGTNNPTSDGGTTFEIYHDNTPSIRLNDGGAYKALFQLRGNDLEIRGSNGQLEFYTGNADGASSSLRGAITSAGHKWTHNGSIFHGSNDVTDFTQAARDTYNNVSIRAGYAGGDTSPTNRTSAIKIYPAGSRNTTTGTLTGGIAWQHLDPNNGAWASTYGEGAQIWMGAAIHDTPGQERDRFNLWMNSSTTANTNPNNLAIEAYPNGIVRHPKVPAFMVRNSNASGAFSGGAIATWNVTIVNNGSNFASNKFTAPIDGIYFFSCMMLSQSGSRLYHEFRVNGTRVDGTRSETHAVANSYTTATITMTYPLSANDYVEVYVGPNAGYGATYTNFNGHLIG